MKHTSMVFLAYLEPVRDWRIVPQVLTRVSLT